MQFSTVAVLALAASSVSAWSNGTVYTTEVVTAYTTYCPASTQVTVNGQTYTVTEATTLTITNCPCTVVKPVYTTSSVAAAATTTPYSNATTTTAKATSSPSVVTVSGGSKALAFSGFSLAGLLGVAAYIL